MSVTEETVRLARARKEQVVQFSDDTLRMLTQAWVETWDELEPELLALATEIAVSYPDGVTVAQLEQLQRYTDTMELVQNRLVELERHSEAVSVEQVQRIVDSTPGAQLEQIRSQLPPGLTSQAAGVVSPPEGALAAIVARTTSSIHSQMFQPLTTDMEQALRTHLVRGIGLGLNPNEVAVNIVRDSGEEFAGGLTRAARIARTEQLDAMRAASAVTHEANSDLVEGWLWLATLDARVCSACLAMHGRRFDTDVVGPEGHPNCRCTSVAAVKSWSELGIEGATEPPSAMPDAQDWFNSLTDSSQRDILGPGKFQLWQDGEIGWDDLAIRRDNPDWRPAYYERPLRELQGAR